MAFDSNNFQIIKTISYRVDNNVLNAPQTVVDASIGNSFPDFEIISINTFIKNLKLYASVPSLPEATLPQFNLEDSATERLYKALDAEWKEPRYQLDLFITDGDIDTQVGAISIVNIGGYPYRTYNLQDLYTDALAIELGDNGQIAIAFKDVGYGYPGVDDKINVFGSYVKEVVHKVETTTNVVVNVNVTGGSTGGNSGNGNGNGNGNGGNTTIEDIMPIYRDGAWYGIIAGRADSDRFFQADRIYYLPFILGTPKKIDMATLSSSTNHQFLGCRIATYTMTTDKKPGALIQDFGTIQGNAIKQKHTQLVPFASAVEHPKEFYIAVHMDANADFFSITGLYQENDIWFGKNDLTNIRDFSDGIGWIEDKTYGTFAATAGSVIKNEDFAPNAWLRIASATAPTLPATETGGGGGE